MTKSTLSLGFLDFQTYKSPILLFGPFRPFFHHLDETSLQFGPFESVFFGTSFAADFILAFLPSEFSFSGYFPTKFVSYIDPKFNKLFCPLDPYEFSSGLSRP